MSTYETLKVVRPFTRYFIASQEVEPSSGWDYRSFSTLVDDPAQSMEQLGERILEGYQALSRAQRRHTSITLALHDLDAFEALESALSELTSAVRTNLGGHLADVGAGRASAEVFGYHADPMRSYDMIDLGDWAQLLARRAAPFVAPAQRVRDALKALVVSEVKGRNKERASGVSVYFPKLAAHYKPAYDQVPTASTWRAFLAAYYDRAGRLGVRPTFKLGLSKGVSASAPPLTEPPCGDGVCQIAEGEDSESCAVDCATDQPHYETPDCDALPYIPKSLRRPAQTEPRCEGQYMFWCTQEDGQWYRHVRYCPDSQRVCGPAWDDPLDPGNVPPGEGCVIPQGTGTLTCQPDGYLELAAELDSGAAQVTAEAFLQYGYYVYFDQQVTLFGRTPADIEGDWVRGRWDQQVLTLSQAPLQRILFAETRFDEEFALAVTYTDQARAARTAPPPSVWSAAANRLSDERSTAVRASYVHLIGAAAESQPEAVAVLAEQYRRESDPRMLKVIGRYVPADKLSR